MLFFSKPAYDKLSIAEGVEKCRKNPKFHLLDVRTKEEYEDGHISGSKNLPLQEIGRIMEYYPDKHSPLYIYCRSGARSKRACQFLVKNGYDQIFDLGGMIHYQGPIEKK